MKYRYVFLLAFANFILSSTILQLFRINDAIPNFCIILSIVFLALYSEKHAYYFAATSGLLQDVFLGRMLGTNLMIYIILVYLATTLIRVLFKGNYLTPVFLIALNTSLYHLLFYLVMFFFQATVPFHLIAGKIFTEIIYNSVLGLLIYSIVFKRTNGYKLGDFNA